MTITTSSLVHDGGKAIDFVSDRIQAAEAALAQLTRPSRTTNFVGCSEAPITRQAAHAVQAGLAEIAAARPLSPAFEHIGDRRECAQLSHCDLPQRSGSRRQRAVHQVCSYGLPAAAGIPFFCRL